MRTYNINSEMYRFSRGAHSVDVPYSAVFAAMGKFSPGTRGTAVADRFLDAMEEFIFSIADFRGYDVSEPAEPFEPLQIQMVPPLSKELPHD